MAKPERPIYESSEKPQFPPAANLWKANQRKDLRGMSRHILTGAGSALTASSKIPRGRNL